jgi:chorismate mutase
MSLEEYRKEIDRINEDIAELVAERMEVVEKIGEFKKEKGMDIKDEGREEIVKEQFADIFSSKNLSKDKGRKLAETLIGMAVKEEKEVKDK